MNKQSKKNQRNRAFLAAIAMLLVSAIVITTASFAWFSLGKSAQVENLDLKVTKEGEGIAISANDSYFGSKLTFAHFKGNGSDDSATTADESKCSATSEDYNYFPKRISPASSEFVTDREKLPAFFMGGVDETSETMTAYAATSEDGKTIYAEEQFEEDGVKADNPYIGTGVGVSTTIPDRCRAAGFYAFDIFVKVDGMETAKVKMSNSSISVATNGGDFEDEGKAAFTEATAKAMRMGFVNVDTGKAVIFGTPESDARGTKPVNTAGTHKASVNVATEGTAGSYACPVDQGSEDVTLELSRGVNQIRVYIWMEGQDPNCTNDLMSQYVSANIVFEMV